MELQHRDYKTFYDVCDNLQPDLGNRPPVNVSTAELLKHTQQSCDSINNRMD